MGSSSGNKAHLIMAIVVVVLLAVFLYLGYVYLITPIINVVSPPAAPTPSPSPGWGSW